MVYLPVAPLKICDTTHYGGYFPESRQTNVATEEAQTGMVTCLSSPGSWGVLGFWASPGALFLLPPSTAWCPLGQAWQGALAWPYLKLQLSVPSPAGFTSLSGEAGRP